MTNSSLQRYAPRDADRTSALARELAQRAAAVTRSRLHLAGDTLNGDELRGYVRARAIGPVRLLAQQLAAEYRLAPQAADELAARTLERTVHLVVRGISSQPILSIPAAVLPLRTAA
jgi:hypothetical protein